MAGQITCDLCGEEYAVSMITRLDNGDSLAVGQSCLLTSHLAIATELIKALSPELAGTYIEPVAALIDAYGQLGAATPENQSRAAAREQYGDLCPECGIAWDKPSPDCPHKIWNLHPLPPAEGAEDEHTADRTAPPDGAATTAASGHGSARRPGRGGVRRPG